MDWNRGCLLLSQVVVCAILGGLVATGHNSLVTDGLLVLTGSLAGTSLYQAVKPKITKE